MLKQDTKEIKDLKMLLPGQSFIGPNINVQFEWTINKQANTIGKAIITIESNGIKTNIEVNSACNQQGKKGTALSKFNDSNWLEYKEPYRPRGGLMKLNNSLFLSAIRTIPNNADISLHINLDELTTSALAKVGLHGDVCRLVCVWTDNGKYNKREFIVGIEITDHSNNRFGFNRGEF